MNNGIQKPVFIIGVARSGTTIFYNLLATNPEAAWFSNYSNKFLGFNQIATIHRLLDMPLVGDTLKKNIISRKGFKLTPRPNEGEEIYHDYCGFEFNTPIYEKEKFIEQEKKFRKVIQNHLKYTGKHAFLSKQTANNQRLRVLDGIFPDARFVHIIRDGRAVANSITQVEWWPDMELWWLDKKVKEWEGDSLELGMLYWEKTITEILDVGQSLGDRYFEIHYEDLCDDVRGTIQKVTDFLGWPASQEYLQRMPETLRCMNHKWQARFSSSYKDMAAHTIGEMLTKLGYTAI